MARGKGSKSSDRQLSGLPVFVDVKLAMEDKDNFIAWLQDGPDPVKLLQRFADDGYRVGVAWQGQQQAYTVSVTCRDEESENNGLCMTSFSRDLAQAVCLAWFKHDVVCRRQWRGFTPPDTEMFG